MRLSKILFLVCIAFVSCDNERPAPIYNSDSEFISALKSSHCLVNYAFMDNGEITPKMLSTFNDSSIVYMLNSSCSVCIAQCISFLQQYNRNVEPGNANIRVIVDREDSIIIDFYFERALNGKKNYVLQKLQNDKVKIEHLQRFNGTILRKVNNQMEAYRYIMPDTK